MGMAASQARYLSLVARMNDIEYQGQQINQQRTTLSSQTTNYYNSLLEMSVPTPPSTKDFTKIEYAGTYAASTFTLGQVTPGKSAGTYNVDLNYTKTGHYWGKTGSTLVTKNQAYYIEDTGFDFNSLSKNIPDKYSSLYDTSKYKEVDFNSEEPYSNDVDVFATVKGSDISSFGSSCIVYEKDEQGRYSEVAVGECDSNKYYVIVTNPTMAIENDDKISNAKVVKNSNEEYQEHTVPAPAYELINDFSGILVSDGNTIRNATNADFNIDQTTGKVTLKEDLFIAKMVSKYAYDNADGKKCTIKTENDGDYIGTHKLSDLSVLLADTTTEQREAYIEGLKNAFPDVWKESDNDESTFLNKFEGYIDNSSGGNAAIKIVRKTDLESIAGTTPNVPLYTYQPNGTYTDTVAQKGCQLEFDANGRIKRIGIPTGEDQWDWIDLKTTEVTDDDAYEDAFNQYEYQKYLYDQKQNEINAKISIVQAEDKNLELKLTRLDNERNAVNTELEAVKKVVQDNIEKSFKTFSG